VSLIRYDGEARKAGGVELAQPDRNPSVSKLLTKQFASLGLLFYFMTSNAAADDTLEQFLAYQEEALSSGAVNEETTAAFYERSFAFWIAHAVDYNAHPEKYDEIVSAYHRNQGKYRRNRTIAIDRYENTIEQFRRFDKRNTLAENPVLFVGSSSIVFWETALAFPEYPVINRGFGGASLPEVLHFYEDVIEKHAPSVMVVYCDIDVENGKSPEFSVNAFKELVSRVEKDFSAIQIVFLSMKPTLIDDVLGKDVRNNKMIANEMLAAYSESKDNLHYVDVTEVMLAEGTRLKEEIFLADGMHLNSRGYDLWNPIVRATLERLVGRRPAE
jgi:lysophospholipase L1-like esterase